MTNLGGEHRKRLIVVGAALVAIILLASSDALHLLIEEMLEFSEQWIGRHPRSGMIVFVLFSMFSAMAAFVSSSVLVPIAIHAWGETTTVVLLLSGWLLGGSTAYVLGRYPGRQVLRWFVSLERLQRYEGMISRRAPFPVVLLFQLALPSEVPGYVLGTLRYRFHVYLAALALGELPYAIGTILLAKSFLEQNYVQLVAVATAGLLLMGGAIVLWQKRRGEKER